MLSRFGPKAWVLASLLVINLSGCASLKQLTFGNEKPIAKSDPAKDFYSKSDQFLYLPSDQPAYQLDYSQWGSGVALIVTDQFFSATGKTCKKTLVQEHKSGRQLDSVILCRVKDDYWLVNRRF